MTRSPRYTTRLVALIGAVTLAAGLAACGTDNTDDAGAGTTAGTSTAASQPGGSDAAAGDGATAGSEAATAGSEAATAGSEAGTAGSAAEPTRGSGETDSSAVAADSAAPAAGGEVVLVTHDSFNMDPAVIKKFEADSGITLTLLAQGDAGSMVNQLVLTKDNPVGDVVFGVDNTFASRALDNDVVAPYASPAAGNGSDDYAIDSAADPDHRLTAVDYGDVCINVDHRWFGEKKLAEPKTYEDLAKPEYKDLLVVPSPATSSPGLAFLLGTIDHFGTDSADNTGGDSTDWQQYWQQLVDNGLKVTAGWEDAYTVDFSGSSGKGDRPLVLSYASSPPFEVADGATEAPTGALLDTCFRQVEYAGVLTGAANPHGAQKMVDFLLSPEFQAALPDQMYVYPVDSDVELPPAWADFAPAAEDAATMDPEQISTHREEWIDAWTDTVEN